MSGLQSLLREAAYVIRLRGPLANEPSARILHALLVGLMGWVLFELAIDVPFFTPRKRAAAALVIFATSAILASLLLLQAGLLRAASLVYVWGIWLVFTVLIIFSGGIHSVAVVYYVAAPVSAAWLLGYKAALAISAVGLGSSLIMAILAVNNIFVPQYFPGMPLGIWAVLVGVMVITAAPGLRVLQVLKESLAQSQRDQESLRQYQEHLEELVEQRTAELVQARDQAQAANWAKSVFLANMSHELRTPLNAILGFSNLLRENSITNRQRQDLNIINRSGEHLLSLINDVLDVAKIDSGRVEIVERSVDLPELVCEVAELMRMQAKEKGLELFVEQRAALPRVVLCDGEKLRQVLINLLGNALKYTEEGAVTLWVSATLAEPLLLTFEVEDTGIGIAPEDQARVFDAFVQVGKHGVQKGTGLGLTISRQFVELMGGTIQVESTSGRGSRFRLELPVERVEDAEAKHSQPDEERIIGLKPGGPEYRIQIVEDEQANWLLLQRMLESAGFKVRVCEDGAQGIDTFRTWRPHFIWMDWRMPVMGGAEATRRIRALEGGTEVKIAAVTASVFASERETVLTSGVDDFVRKPYRRAEIFECMARHLGVEYVSDSVELAPVERPRELRQEDLRTLPEGLRSELADALIRLDTSRIGQIIDRVRERDPDAGSMLASWAGRLAYSEILDAIKGQRISVGSGA